MVIRIFPQDTKARFGKYIIYGWHLSVWHGHAYWSVNAGGHCVKLWYLQEVPHIERYGACLTKTCSYNHIGIRTHEKQ